MSNSPPTIRRTGRVIRGPQSALTDFLASHNINANQIREEAIARRAAALASESAQNATEPSSSTADITSPTGAKTESKEDEKKRKINETNIASIKASKSLKRRRIQKVTFSDDDLSDDDINNDSFSFMKYLDSQKQMTNCEICDKRFLVTAYTRAAPDTQNNGLLCPKCACDLDKEERSQKKQKSLNSGAARRKKASNILDGEFLHTGAKNLVSLCVETLANNVQDADSFGSLPLDLIQKLGAILAKRRLITSPILDLFLEQKHETLVITDGAKLNSDDYCRIFQLVPSIKHLKLRNAIQFKNKVMDHLLGTTVNLVSFDIHGANLIDDERWDNFLRQKAAHLRTLKVHFTDSHFGDRAVELLPKFCPELRRLKISHNAKVSNDGLEHIALLSNLEHLSIELYRPIGTKPISPIPVNKILENIGSKLQTFSLESVSQIDDSVLVAIHNNCQHLKKFRITGSEKMTDKGFSLLFRHWVNPPLSFIDLSGCRLIDDIGTRNNTRGIGLCSLGFEALMLHSGPSLRHLNISYCRHISSESFESAFAAEKRYPDLEEMDVSFCQAVNDFIVGCIFRSCPKLKILIVFGCFGVKDIKVPKGKVLIGTPNAKGMRIEIEGTED